MWSAHYSLIVVAQGASNHPCSPGQRQPPQRTRPYRPSGNRTQTYDYDNVGNTTAIHTTDNPASSTQTFEWNTEGQLAKVSEEGNDVTFVYDAAGNRLIRKDPTGSTLYLPGGTELRAYNGASTATGTRYYSMGGKSVAMRKSDGTVTYLTADHHGTAQIAVDAATQASTVRRFTPFGVVRGFDDDATWPNDKGFLGGTKDPTGLTHLGAREYDPQTGRFISVDPVLNQADPQQMNGYTYANNSPVTFADPTGTCPGNSCSADFAHTGPHARPSKSRDWSRGRSSGSSSRVSRAMADPGGTPAANYCATLSTGIFTCYGSRKKLEDAQLADMILYIFSIYDIYDCVDGKVTSCGSPVTKRVEEIVDLLRAMRRGVDTPSTPGGRPNNPPGNGSPRVKPKRDEPSPTKPKREGPTNSKPKPKAKPKPEPRREGSSPRRCSSFPPGTQVLLADGSYRDIEDIEVSDKVLATDPKQCLRCDMPPSIAPVRKSRPWRFRRRHPEQ